MRAVTALGVATLVLAACGGDGGLTGPDEVTSVVLSTSDAAAMTATGETRLVTATVRRAGGAPLPAPAVSWSSSDTGVATVSESGATALVTAVDDGAAVITANAGAVSATLTVSVRRALASIAVSAPAVLAYGSSVTLDATARDPRGHAIAGVTDFAFSSSDPESVAVSNDGVATAIFRLDAPPATTVTASATRDGLTVSGAAQVATGPPAVFDHAALLLSEYELPARVPTDGQGIAYFAVDGASIRYTVAWSALSSPALGASLRGPATASELADVLVDLHPSAQTSSHGSVSGAFDADDVRPVGTSLETIISLMDRGGAYVEVTTAEFPSGEIRGQVVDVGR